MTIRVVIAEDEAIIRLDLKETLEEEGYEVVGETGRGDEAVDLVKQHQPDLAILDVKMPGMDGLEAASAITAEKGAAVLILTAFSQRDLIEKARDAGALTVLPLGLNFCAGSRVSAGEFAAAEALGEEAQGVSLAITNPDVSISSLLLAGWRGRQAEAGPARPGCRP